MARVLVYQMWPIAWPGGFKQMTEHLSKVKELGATHVWLSPIFPSPRKDHGYDVSSYLRTDDRFGPMKDFSNFVIRAHELKLKVIIDLVLNHTSIDHPWFTNKPEYYIWRDEPNEWTNMFDGGSAWEKKDDKYYCHLFDKSQADLAWFDENGRINRSLLTDFRNVVRLWLSQYRVDGFRLDAIQAMNKGEDLFTGSRAARVVREVFKDFDAFLIGEIIDYTNGTLIKKYCKECHVDYCLNISLKSEWDESSTKFHQALQTNSSVNGFMLDVESHDSPRFTSRSGMTPLQISHMMFAKSITAVCMYQGQELGLKNPRPENLSLEEMCELDVQTALKLEAGEDPEEVRRLSRANARVPLPLEEYAIQEKNSGSSLNIYKKAIQEWKKYADIPR